MIEEIKKVIKENDIYFNSLENELTFIQGYLMAKKKNVPPKIFVNMIENKSSFGFKY
tara:strand:+ start:304 stop:474 length:171 start_codon:yes stop_codon:yes gene_type:complete